MILSPHGKGNSRLSKLLGGLSYQKNPEVQLLPYVTARWTPQQIPPSNFLASDIFYIRAHFTKYQHQFFNEVNISEALISLYRHFASLQLQGCLFSTLGKLNHIQRQNTLHHILNKAVWTRRFSNYQSRSLINEPKGHLWPHTCQGHMSQATNQVVRTIFFSPFGCTHHHVGSHKKPPEDPPLVGRWVLHHGPQCFLSNMQHINIHRKPPSEVSPAFSLNLPTYKQP